MPWSASDAHRHKKGLSARQARTWASVANSVLQKCLTDGGSQSRCEASAVRQANGVVGSAEVSTHAAGPRTLLTVNTALTVSPQRLVRNEREYLVAPCCMIVEGVLNGGYVSGEAIRHCQWDGMPLVVNHPLDMTGAAVSANDPDVLATCGVGRVYRTQYLPLTRSGYALTRAQAEIWMDIAQVTALQGEAEHTLQMLETQQPVEVSTGFYCDTEYRRGSFLGVPFTMVHSNLYADHLALLPNSIGACDWQLGCGAPRLNHQEACACGGACAACQEGEAMEESPKRGWRGFVAMLRDFVSTESTDLPAEEDTHVPDDSHAQAAPALSFETNMTDTDTRESLYGALAREMGADVTPVYIDSISSTNQTFTYRKGERLVQRSWTTDEHDILRLRDDETDVQRDTRYLPVPSPVTEEQEEIAVTTPAQPTTAVKRRVAALIADPGYAWDDRDRDMLERLDEATLIRMEQQPKLQPTPEPVKPRTFEQILAAADPRAREGIEEAMEDIATRKQTAITTLTAIAIPFTAEQLEAMPAKHLEKLVELVSASSADYSGQGGPHQRPKVDPETLPPDPPDTSVRVLARQKELGMGAYLR